MKFELEQRDENFIDVVTKRLQDENESVNVKRALLLKHPDRKYNLVFSIKDLAKANNFIMDIFGPREEADEIQKEFEEATGIMIESVGCSEADAKVENLKSYLNQVLNELENL